VLTIWSFTVFPSSSIVLIFWNIISQYCEGPYGQRYAVATSTYEIDTDGGDVTFCVRIIGESKQQARLSNAGVSDEKEFEEIVVSIPQVQVS
jgi:hypothetical protein